RRRRSRAPPAGRGADQGAGRAAHRAARGLRAVRDPGADLRRGRGPGRLEGLHHARARVPRQAQAARPAGLVPGRRTTMSDEGSGDLLARATRALRAESSAPEAAAEGPWQIMDGWSAVARSMRRAGRRRRLLLLGGLQVGLALAGLGAWAAVSGHLPALFSAPAPASEPGAAPR